MKLLVVTRAACELSHLLQETVEECTVCAPNHVPFDLQQYDSIALLGGTEHAPLALWADEIMRLEEFARGGKKVFVEYSSQFASYHAVGAANTRFARPVLIDDSVLNGKLQHGVIFDEQSNDRIFPRPNNRTCDPILQYVDYPKGFYTMPDVDTLEKDETRFALWKETDTVCICSFRMANFASAKFAPQRYWAELIAWIVSWLGGMCSPEKVKEYLHRPYHLRGTVCESAEMINKAMEWFKRADMLIDRDGQAYSVKEGLSAHVKPDGTHEIAETPRLDCTGEAALMYFLKAQLDGDADAARTAESLRKSVLDCQRRSGLYKGLLSWMGTGVSYQDDHARGFLLPELWRAFLSGDYSMLPRVKDTLDYLLSTTGTDGLRMCRVDFLDAEKPEISYMGLERVTTGKWHWKEWMKKTPEGKTATIQELQKIPSGCPSAHYNATFMASLLFYGILTKEKLYIDAGEKGLSTLMEYYPQTAREHSQTQELSRLIFPLALLYAVTKDPKKKAWLYRVADDLETFHRPGGGYQEWDEGYTACSAGVKIGEASVLAENGNPVADMLYTMAWLPIGFTTAYIATGDAVFVQRENELIEFLSKIQVVSENRFLDGVWPRSIDMDYMEIYGVPNDVGWAPWSVESGWTVAEITAGILLNKIEEKRNLVFPEIESFL